MLRGGWWACGPRDSSASVPGRSSDDRDGVKHGACGSFDLDGEGYEEEFIYAVPGKVFQVDRLEQVDGVFDKQECMDRLGVGRRPRVGSRLNLEGFRITSGGNDTLLEQPPGRADVGSGGYVPGHAFGVGPFAHIAGADHYDVTGGDGDALVPGDGLEFF